jgi:hypothetical protein
MYDSHWKAKNDFQNSAPEMSELPGVSYQNVAHITNYF